MSHGYGIVDIDLHLPLQSRLELVNIPAQGWVPRYYLQEILDCSGYISLVQFDMIQVN